MAHFAKLGNNNIVERVEVVHNNIATDEQAGITFLQNLYNDTATWKQTSYNTLANTHKLSGTAFRGNYASVGYTYNEDIDAFIPPKPYNSWILNETTCLWEAPVQYPTDNQDYIWNETSQTWDLKE
tara:strand:+ start:234 stop:611 length:378 start_codon:yes stop_codon:yes gene_type:complete